PVIKPVSNTTYAVLVAIGICTPIAALQQSGLPVSSFDTGSLALAQKSETSDAERRRALALRALDMRIQEQQTQQGGEIKYAPEESHPESQDVKVPNE
ncbi:hypothetical protein HK098_005392, partial [Nowakowskiella sp. JEL0407]